MPYEAAAILALLVGHAKRKQSRLVLGSDVNAYHAQWGSEHKY